MQYTDLREWIDAADAIGELRTVEGASWERDIGEISEMLIHTLGAPTVLFDQIPGYPGGQRVLVNCNATRSRLALTLGLPTNIERRPLMDEFLRLTENDRAFEPDVLHDAPLFENVQRGDDVDVYTFPTPQWHPEDGGRYIGTGVAIVTRDPDSGWLNLGCYRVMIHDEKNVGALHLPGQARPQPCATSTSTAASRARSRSSAAWIRCSSPRPRWRCRSASPSTSGAAAIRGEPLPSRQRADHRACRSRRRRDRARGLHPRRQDEAGGPVRRVDRLLRRPPAGRAGHDLKAVYYRNDPIMLGVPPNKPPAYDPYLYREYLRSALLLRELRGTGVPGIVDVNCLAVGGTRLFNVVSIKQSYAGHARQALHAPALCNAASYMGRIVVVVDEDIDVTDLDEVIWAIFTRVDPERAVDIIKRCCRARSTRRSTLTRRGTTRAC